MASDIFARIDELLEEAEKAATLENASFGFPEDRIEIKSVHFGNDEKGREGDVLHPTDYVRNITAIYHNSWIIGPIRQVRELLKLHSGLIHETAKLREILESPELNRAISLAENLVTKVRAGRL